MNGCPVGGEAVSGKIAAIMGVEAGASERKVAFVACMGDCEKAKQDYDYTGHQDCRMMYPEAGRSPAAAVAWDSEPARMPVLLTLFM